MSEVKPSIQMKDLEKIDIRVGTILLVEDVRRSRYRPEPGQAEMR